MTKWQDREHSSRFHGRNGASGWEFDTRDEAIRYINDQYNHQHPKHVADFSCEVRSHGVQVRFSAYGVVQTSTYRKGETMRDLERLVSPSDCIWMIPGTAAMEYCNYYRD